MPSADTQGYRRAPRDTNSFAYTRRICTTQVLGRRRTVRRSWSRQRLTDAASRIWRATLKPVKTACLLSIVLGGAPQTQSGAATSKPAAGVAWLVFVDDLHIDFRNTGLVRRFLQGL